MARDGRNISIVNPSWFENGLNIYSMIPKNPLHTAQTGQLASEIDLTPPSPPPSRSDPNDKSSAGKYCKLANVFCRDANSSHMHACLVPGRYDASRSAVLFCCRGGTKGGTKTGSVSACHQKWQVHQAGNTSLMPHRQWKIFPFHGLIAKVQLQVFQGFSFSWVIDGNSNP